MSSKALSIAAAIRTALTTPAMASVAATKVTADPLDALESQDFPAITVELGDEDPPEAFVVGAADRWLDVVVTVLSNGPAPYDRADAALIESHARIFADRTLGGLAMDMKEGATRRTRDGIGEGIAATEKVYRVQYRTTETSLES